MNTLKVSRGFRVSRLLTVVVAIFAFSNRIYSQSNTAHIDVSGQDGMNASSGQSYSTSPGASSGRGQSGGDAGRSTPGANSKNINVYLKDLGEGRRAQVEIKAEVQGQGSRSHLINLTSNSSIRISARGGKGGDGGRGGDGQGGCNGRDGFNATASSRGGDGTNGCDGGDAGRGSPGSDGGFGGDAKIFIPLEDVHLALLTSCDVSGGDSGRGGQHGNPGSGGRGGRGGSSYYRSYQVADGQDCTDRLENNGNGSYTTVRDCTTRYRTETESNPGGMDGRDGSRGSSASGNISAGHRGKDGICTFIAQDGKRRYQGSKPFYVQIQGYNLIDEDKNGIFEPNETIYIEQIKIKNTGDLPSPSGKAVFKVFMKNTRYTTASEHTLELPRINPGQVIKLDKTLQFKINSNSSVGQNERLVLQDTISPSNLLTRVEQSQPGFEKAQNILITYPIEITAFSAKASVGAGETIPVFWKVKNISGRDFGGESAFKRSIRTALNKVGGDAAASDLKFISKDARSEQNLTDAYWTEILNLKAGQEKIIEGFLEVGSNAMPYTEHTLTTDLFIQNFVGKEQKIQTNGVSLRISQIYNYNPQSEFLLLTNKNTTREEFVAWNDVVKTLDTSFDVWDLSYYGRLSFNNSLKELEGKALKDVLANKTIVVLNNGGVSKHDFSMDETIKLLSQKKANFLVLGGTKKDLTQMFKDLMSIPVEETSLTAKSKVDVFKNYFRLAFWSRPNQEDFLKAIQENAASVLKEDPKSRFFIRSTYNPRKMEGGRYSLGSINYFRTLTPGEGRAVFLPYEIETIQRASTINSSEIRRALLLPTSFTFKIKTYLKNRGTLLGNMIADAILYDLFLEMDLADIVCEFSECTLDLITKMHQFRDSVLSQPTQYDIHLLGSVKIYLEELDSSLLKTNYEKLLGSQLTSNEVKGVARLLNQQAKERKRSLPGIEDRKNIRNMLTLPAVHRAITTDSLLRNGNVLSQELAR